MKNVLILLGVSASLLGCLSEVPVEPEEPDVEPSQRVASPEKSPASSSRTYDHEGSLGRWCATPTNLRNVWHVIEIVDQDGEWAAHYDFGDSSDLTKVFVAKSPREFEEREDNPFEERYVIDPDGWLAVYDIDGLIHRARPLAGGAANKSCFQGQPNPLS